MKKLLLIIIITSRFTLGIDVECDFEGKTSGEQFCIDSRAVFFFDTTHLDGVDYILYIEKDGMKYRTKALNTITRKEVYLPGLFDPVASGNILTVPIKDETGQFNLNFYSLKELLNSEEDNADAKSVFTDTQMKGNYQSIGRLGKEDKYRVILETDDSNGGGLLVRDYKISQNVEKVEPLSEVKSLCPSLKIKTPKISNKGNYLTGVDDGGNTKIFKINSDFSCKEVYNLGVKVGKVDFMEDKMEAVFHVGGNDLFNGNNTNYSESPLGGETMNSFKVNIENGQVTPLTQNAGASSYYPSFSENGGDIFLSHKNLDNTSCFVKFKADTTSQSFVNGSCLQAESLSLFIESFLTNLGQSCGDLNEEGNKIFKTLDCETVKGLPETDWRRAACVEDDNPDFIDQIYNSYDNDFRTFEKSANTILEKKCFSCHSSVDFLPTTYSDEERSEFFENAYHRVTSHPRNPVAMPPANSGHSLTKSQSEILALYFLAFQ